MPLLWYLRDELDLTGTKFGCGIAECGACTVHLDGKAVRACVTPMSGVAGRKVTTIEGLVTDGTHPVQKAWHDAQRAAMRLLPGRPDHAGRGLARQPTRTPPSSEINETMAGNICRCGCYQRITAAVKQPRRGRDMTDDHRECQPPRLPQSPRHGGFVVAAQFLPARTLAGCTPTIRPAPARCPMAS